MLRLAGSLSLIKTTLSNVKFFIDTTGPGSVYVTTPTASVSLTTPTDESAADPSNIIVITAISAVATLLLAAVLVIGCVAVTIATLRKKQKAYNNRLSLHSKYSCVPTYCST